MKKKWIILANWAISPLWYVLGLFIYYMADGVATGQCEIKGVFDIIISILMLIFLVPQATVMYVLYNLPTFLHIMPLAAQ
jgi:hypothetical protein